MNREYHFRVKGDEGQIRRAVTRLDGDIQTVVTDEEGVSITWTPNTHADPLQNVADILKEGDYEDGTLLLELFLSDEPTDTTALFNLGMAYSNQGEWDRAIQVLQRLIDIEPQHTNGLVALGVALLHAGRTQEGIDELQNALSQEPENVWATQNMGVGLMKLGRYPDALEHLRRALELRPDDPALWLDYAEVLASSGDSLEAGKAYRKVIDLDQSSESAERARAALSQK